MWQFIITIWKEYLERRKLRRIALFVCRYMNVRFKDFKAKKRTASISMAKHCYILIALEETNQSQRAICDVCNLKPCIIYYLRNVKLQEPQFIREYEEVKRCY